MTSKGHVKVPPPRPLTDSESTHSLTQWRINFKQYCKRDEAFKLFLQSDTTWDASRENYGFEADHGNRSPIQLADDLEDFLHMLASFLPHGYITEKIVRKSTSLSSAFAIIEENFGLVPSQESWCDFATLSRAPNEPYRQFYDRMVSFVTKHLMAEDVKNTEVDGVIIPRGGDQLTVSLLNMVALNWIQKLHPDLLKIVRTEYSKELRENTALAALVPRISLSVDAMLSKYDKVPALNFVAGSDKEAHGLKEGGQVLKVNSGRQQNSGGGNSNRRKGGMFCPGCFYLGNRAKAKINYKHYPSSCPRSASLVAMIEAEELEDGDSGTVYYDNHSNNLHHQDTLMIPVRTVMSTDRVKQDLKQVTVPKDSADFMCDILENKSLMDSIILRLSSSIQRAPSPSLLISLNGFPTTAIIDEGSELNCIDFKYAIICRIQLGNSELIARSAGNHNMQVKGQAKDDVQIKVLSTGDGACMNLGKCVVIDNLGVDLLIGQPAKIKHEITTKPHLDEVVFKDTGGNIHTCNSSQHHGSEIPAEVLRVKQCMSIYPGEMWTSQLSQKFSCVRKVLVSPRREAQNVGMVPTFLSVSKDGLIHIPNNSDNIWTFKKTNTWRTLDKQLAQIRHAFQNCMFRKRQILHLLKK